MPPRLQPNSFSNDSMKMLGIERTPADTSNVKKVTARTIQP